MKIAPPIPAVIDRNSADFSFFTPERREWWRWHFAGQIIGHQLSFMSSRLGEISLHPDILGVAQRSAIIHADSLIAELEKEQRALTPTTSKEPNSGKEEK